MSDDDTKDYDRIICVGPTGSVIAEFGIDDRAGTTQQAVAQIVHWIFFVRRGQPWPPRGF